VYASTFYQAAKEYIQITTYRLEEEKMAVIIQKMVGTQHGSRFCVILVLTYVWVPFVAMGSNPSVRGGASPGGFESFGSAGTPGGRQSHSTPGF
jgi:hypothetical protein